MEKIINIIVAVIIIAAVYVVVNNKGVNPVVKEMNKTRIEQKYNKAVKEQAKQQKLEREVRAWLKTVQK